MFGFKHKAKAAMALVLACLLLISAIPVFAENSSEDNSLKIAVADASYDGNDGGTGGDGYPYYSTISAAIDSFNNAGGTVYVKGEFTVGGYDLEGGDSTTAGRGDVIIEGYNGSSANGTIKFTETGDSVNTAGQDWQKGNVTFKNITIKTYSYINSKNTENLNFSNGAKSSLGSGGYTLTMGDGIVFGGSSTKDNTATDAQIVIGANWNTTKNQHFVIESGIYRSVSPLAYSNASNKTVNIDTVIDVKGGTISSITSTANAISGDKGVTVNGDVTVNITGGTINSLSFLPESYRAEGSVKGDTIFNVNGGKITAIKAQLSMIGGNAPTHNVVSNSDGTRSIVENSNYVVPERGNMAVVIDAAKTTSATIGWAYGTTSLDYFKLAEGKVLIGIINNYTGTGCVFNTGNYVETSYTAGTTGETNYCKFTYNDTDKCVLNRYDYKLTVADGEAHPVFERTDATDPSTSYLVGFTVESNTAGLTPYINGTKLTPISGKTTADGKAVYDLSAYKSDREDATDDAVITNITFVDERPVVVSTDENFNPTEYKKVATINEAIAALGANGGTVYIKGTYTISGQNGMVTEFAATSNIASGKKVVITGYVDESTSSTEDNEIVFGTYSYLNDKDVTCYAHVALNGNWLHCNLEFNNLKLSCATQSESNNFNSNGYELTFGNGLVTDLPSGIIGDMKDNTTNNITVNSGTYKGLYSFYGWGKMFTNANVNYTFNGGEFITADESKFFMGINSNQGGNTGTTGDITWTINGGTFKTPDGKTTTIQTSGRGSVGASSYRGILRLNINGGTFTEVHIRAGKERNEDNTANITRYTNQVVTLDNSKVDFPINAQLNNDSGYSIDDAKASGKKIIAIVNNFSKTTGNLIYNPEGLAYALQVKGGEADAVFNGTGETAAFTGFTITPSAENTGKLAIVNGTDVVVPNDSGIYDLSAYEFGGVINITFADAKDLTVIYEQYDNIDAYRTEGNFTAPEKAGYVFGGWYSDANGENAYTAETIGEGTVFYAKFVPERVLYTGLQLTANTTEDSENTNIRFISTVDSTKYGKVTLTLKRGSGSDMVMDMTTVYSKITGYEGEAAITYEPTYYSAASKYFITHTVTGVPQSAFDTEMTVTASWTTLDGTVVTGKTATFTISELL